MQTTKNNKFADLELEVLSSSVSFRNWLDSNLPFYQDNNVPKEHLLIYIDYIEEQIRKSKNISRELWLRAIKDLRRKVEVAYE